MNTTDQIIETYKKASQLDPVAAKEARKAFYNFSRQTYARAALILPKQGWVFEYPKG